MTVRSEAVTGIYVADGEVEGEPDADAEGDGELDGDGEADGEELAEADGVLDAEAEGVPDGLLDVEADAITVPMLLFSTSQRYEPDGPDPEIVTEISGRKSLASANTAFVSRATLKPAAAVTTMSPPPSVFIRIAARMPALEGAASVRVSPEAPETSSQICRSLVKRIVPPLPGSVTLLGPRYRKCSS